MPQVDLEKRRVYARGWYARHKEELRLRYLTNREEKRAYARAWYHNHMDRIRVYQYHYNHSEKGKQADKRGKLKKRYGLTRQGYESLCAAAGGCCAICRTENGNGTARLTVDHDHLTGRIRGLICGLCNSGLGFFREDQATMKAAIEYLGNTG